MCSNVLIVVCVLLVSIWLAVGVPPGGALSQPLDGGGRWRSWYATQRYPDAQAFVKERACLRGCAGGGGGGYMEEEAFAAAAVSGVAPTPNRAESTGLRRSESISLWIMISVLAILKS